MPSTTQPLAPYRIAWASPRLSPERATAGPLTLRYTLGSGTSGPGTSIADLVAAPKLDRLTRSERIVNPDFTVSLRLQTIWQRTMEAIEASFAAQGGQITDLRAILLRIEAAEQKAEVARAQAAQTARDNALETSYPDPSNVLSAGAGGSITIAAHTRVYGDGSTAPVNAGFVSGFMPGDYVTVYYVDAARTGGAVMYQATTGLVAQKDATHIVGQVTIPQAGEPDSGGTAPTPPGYTPRDRSTPSVSIE